MRAKMQSTMGQLVSVARVWIGAMFLAATPRGQADRPFTAVWNSPTMWCETRYGIDMPLTDYDIIENTGGVWKGDQMVIFYKSQLGLYPWLDKDEDAIEDTWIPIHGGIPQDADAEAHFIQTAHDIEVAIPDKDFSGYAVIDWEEWRPIYDRNWSQMRVYQQKSRDKVELVHPDWDEAAINDEARVQFEEAARVLMEGSLKVARDLRPYGKWGFYGFPACYNHGGEAFCSDTVIDANNQLSWLFAASNAIYPTAYIRDKTVDGRNYVYGQVAEALRVRDLYTVPGTPTLLYTRYTIGDNEYYDKDDLDNSIRISAEMGADGVIIWGSSAATETKDQCESLRTFIMNTFGPYTKNIIDSAEMCSNSLCNSNGRCRHENPLYSQPQPEKYSIRSEDTEKIQDANRVQDVAYMKWRKTLKLHRHLRQLYQDEYSCQCFLGWEGAQCDTAVMF